MPGLRQSLDLAPGESVAGHAAVSREIELNYPEYRIVRLYLVPFQDDGVDAPESSRPGDEHRVDEPRFAVILGDVTQEVHSTRERIESEKINSILLLAAGVAHELGNPLNSLTIHLQLLQRHLGKATKSPGLDKAVASLEVCQNEVQRLDGIIRNFLEAIRPQRPDFSEVDLLIVLEEVLRVQGPELQDRGLAVEVEVESEVGSAVVNADRNQVKQVFFNVIKNAMEAMMRAAGCTSRRARTTTSSTCSSATRARASPKTTFRGCSNRSIPPSRSGHGLGLMIVQRIMRDHGGQVGIDSREGVGHDRHAAISPQRPARAHAGTLKQTHASPGRTCPDSFRSPDFRTIDRKNDPLGLL